MNGKNPKFFIFHNLILSKIKIKLVDFLIYLIRKILNCKMYLSFDTCYFYADKNDKNYFGNEEINLNEEALKYYFKKGKK